MVDRIYDNDMKTEEAMNIVKFPTECIFQFEQPLFAEEDFLLRILQSKIALEYCLHENNNISGFVRVSNRLPHGKCFIRYTLNNWTSYTDVEASLLIENYNEEQSNRFFFNLPFCNSSCTEFAICYKSNQEECWDNNSCNNYRAGQL